MNKGLSIILSLLLFQSCIPLRIAPSIEDYKVTKGKKFKRSLPKREMFVFEDPKDATHFYNYVNTKFGLNDENVYDDVPFMINDEQYFLAFYEVEIPTKTINLIPVFFDAIMERANMDPILDDVYSSRIGNWYLAIEVYSDTEKDCLSENSLSRTTVLKYLRALKKEYLSTQNYNEVVFKN